MAWQPPTSPVRVVLLLSLVLGLTSCGGGTTADPVTSAETGPAAATAGVPTQPPPAATPEAARSVRAPRVRPDGRSAPQPREQRPPAEGTSSGASAVPPPTPAPATTTPQPKRPRPAAAKPQPAGTPIDERAVLALTRRAGLAHYFQAGTVTGTYDGTMAIEVRITSKGVIVNFTATLEGGTISGRALAVAVLDGTSMPGLRGTAAIHRGTGRFARVHGRRLRITGRARPDGSRARVRLAGTVFD